jgi:hypothetical protein
MARPDLGGVGMNAFDGAHAKPFSEADAEERLERLSREARLVLELRGVTSDPASLPASEPLRGPRTERDDREPGRL